MQRMSMDTRPRSRWTRRVATVWAIVLASGIGLARAGDSFVDARATAGESLRSELRSMIGAARDQVFPALVNISVVTVDYWSGQEHKGRSTGSGTIISPDGYVVTNQHVTDGGMKFTCTLSDKQEISAELIGEDPLTDLAVLKLNLEDLESPDQPLHVARFGDSDTLQIGDYVMAMGSPFALSRSVSLGIVMNTDRVFKSAGSADDMELSAGQRTGLFTNWIQHDAAINPGNSGGPLVNLSGEVIGVNELGGSSMGFAIPANLAKTVVADLIEHGRVPRSWYGISLRPIAKTGLTRGVLVDSVVTDGPADEAGLQAGDAIVAIDGEPLTIRFPEEVPPLMKRLASVAAGKILVVSVERDEAEIELRVKTIPLEEDLGDEMAFRAWGLTAQAITSKMARDLRLDSTDGVLVTSLRGGGPAQLAEPPIEYGSIIHAVDHTPIADIDAFTEVYRSIMKADPIPEYVLIDFEHGGKSHITLIEPKPDEEDDPPREMRKAWVGIATQPVLDKLADRIGLEGQRGYRISRVYPLTKAADTDLRVGDIVLAIDGDAVKPRGMQDAGLLARKIRRMRIGDTVALTVLRDKNTLEIPVELEPTRITPSEARTDKNRDFQMTVRELTFFDRDENRWDADVKGVLVTNVEQGGWAGLGGLWPGDLIQKIGDEEIKGLKRYREVMKEVTKAEPERVVIVVLRGVRTHYLYLEPEWEPKAAGRTESKDESKE